MFLRTNMWKWWTQAVRKPGNSVMFSQLQRVCQAIRFLIFRSYVTPEKTMAHCRNDSQTNKNRKSSWKPIDLTGNLWQ